MLTINYSIRPFRNIISQKLWISRYEKLFLRKKWGFPPSFFFPKPEGKKTPVKSTFLGVGRRSYVITKKKNQPSLTKIYWKVYYEFTVSFILRLQEDDPSDFWLFLSISQNSDDTRLAGSLELRSMIHRRLNIWMLNTCSQKYREYVENCKCMIF